MFEAIFIGRLAGRVLFFWFLAKSSDFYAAVPTFTKLNSLFKMFYQLYLLGMIFSKTNF